MHDPAGHGSHSFMKQYSFLILSLFFLPSCVGHEKEFIRSLNAPSFADWILLNGKIITLNESSSTEEAVAVKDGVIVAVGGDGEMRRWRGPKTRELNLAGRTVIPGLNDSHIHASAAALSADPEIRSLDRARQSLRRLFGELNRLGITSIGDVHTDRVSFAHRRLLHDMARAGDLTLRINFYFAPKEGANQMEQLSRAVAEVQQLKQTDMFHFAGFADVSAPGNSDDEAELAPKYMPLSATAKEMLRRSLQFFAAGGHNFQVPGGRDNRARELLEVIEAVNRETPLSRLRIGFTHLGDAAPATIERIKQLGAGIVVQSPLAVLGANIAQLSREKEIPSAPPLRTVVDAGVPLGVGSGAFRSGNYSPLLALWWLITGKNITGTPMRDPKQNLSRMEALRAYTLGRAWFTEDEKRKGSIEVGKFADLVVLNGDYLTVPVDRLPALESLLTMVGGRVVYAAGPFARFEKP